MGYNFSRELQTLLIGLASIGVASLVIAFAVAGFVTGLIIPAFFLILWMGAAALDRRMIPGMFKNPTRDEWTVVMASIVLIAVTAVVAVIADSYVWVAVPLAGALAIQSAYALSHRSDRRSSQIDLQNRTGTHSEPHVILGGWFDTLEKVDIFESLSRDELLVVAALGNVRTISDGANLGVEGQKGRLTYVILRGQAELSAYSQIGRITVRMAGPGESLPLASILGDGLLITSVYARSEIIVWEVDSDRLKNFFVDRPDIAAKVYKSAATILAERYRSTLRRLTDQSATVLQGDDFWVNV